MPKPQPADRSVSKPNGRSNNPIVGVRMPAELKRDIDKRARRQGRSAAGHIRYLIRNDLGQPQDI